MIPTPPILLIINTSKKWHFIKKSETLSLKIPQPVIYFYFIKQQLKAK